MSQRPTRRRLLQFGSVGLTLGVAGCSSQGGTDETNENGDENDRQDQDHDSQPAVTAAGPNEVATVTMETGDDGDRFDPHVVWIEVGGSVEWRLESGVHTATAYHEDADRPTRIPAAADPFDSGMLQEEGESFEHTFTVEGVYDYYCAPHEGMGMIGAVIVGHPDPDGDEPGLAPPQDDFSETVQEKLIALNTQVIDALGETPHDPSEPAETDDESADDPNDEESPSETDSEDEATDETDATAEVTIPDRRFAPDLVQIPVGGTVRWRFEDDAHTVTAYEDRIPASSDGFDSGFTSTGDVFEHTFELEGVYDYYCQPHTGHGMVGSVIVGEPDPDGDEPGLADPSQGGEEGTALESLTTRTLEQLRTDGDGGDDAIDAATLDEADGEIDIEIQTDDSGVRAGEQAPIVARFEGSRLANAPVDVDGDFQGYTEADGTFEITVPRDLEAGDDCRIEIRVDGARGRIEVPVVD